MLELDPATETKIQALTGGRSNHLCVDIRTLHFEVAVVDSQALVTATVRSCQENVTLAGEKSYPISLMLNARRSFIKTSL